MNRKSESVKRDVPTQTHSMWGNLTTVSDRPPETEQDRFTKMLDAMIERARQAIRNIN